MIREDMTLVDRFKSIEQIPIKLNVAFKNYQNELSGINENAIHFELDEPSISQDKLDLMKMNLANEFALKNSVVRDSIGGVMRVSDSLHELAEIDKGYKKFIPRRKNKAHNERLSDLEEVIGKHSHLEANGFLSGNSLMVNFVLGSGLMGGGYVVFKKFIQNNFSNQNIPISGSEYDFGNILFGGAVALYLGGMTFSSICQTLKTRNNVESARYIDDQFRKLF